MKFHKAYEAIKVKGLAYLQNFISQEQKAQLLHLIDSNEWDEVIFRRQQHYGIRYYQTSQHLSDLQPINQDLKKPYKLSVFDFIINRMMENGIFERSNPPNQCLINQYRKANKLSMHVEDKQAFGDIICGLSLGGSEWLRLQNQQTKRQTRLLLQDCSLYVLKDEVRNSWRHGIGKNNDGDVNFRTGDWRRVSLTFRHVLEGRRKTDRNDTDRLIKSQSPH